MVKASSGEDLYAQLEALPEHVVGEILHGELVVSPRPAPSHTLASSTIGGELYQAFGRGGGGAWWILFEPELHLGKDEPDILVPDIAGWRRERMPAMPGEAYFPLAPDWVCEILSPRTAAVDRVRKMPIYAREGVPHLWIVDPLAHTLEVFVLQGSRWVVHAAYEGHVTVHAPPFEQAAFDLGLWWPPGTGEEPGNLSAPENSTEPQEP